MLVTEKTIKEALKGPDVQKIRSIEELGANGSLLFSYCQNRIKSGQLATMDHEESDSSFHFLKTEGGIAIYKVKKKAIFIFLLTEAEAGVFSVPTYFQKSAYQAAFAL